MAMQLVVTAGPDRGRTFPLTGSQTALLGRSQEADFTLSDPRVSRKHVLIEVDQGSVRISDNGSAAGSFVNGQRVTRHELRPGDVIRVGDSELQFRLEAQPEATTILASPPAEQPALAARDLSRLIGQTIHHYTIERELAKSKNGVVFLARDTAKDRQLALKVLWPEISTNEQEMARFVRAMKTMFPLRHPNIIRIYNAGQTGPHAWYAMEYVEGESLTKIIERIGTAGMLDWQSVFRVAVQIARALEAAYEHKIIHRNISPENIIRRSSDKLAKLGDLMLAKALEGTMADQITRPGELIGDIAYMSPERTRGMADVDCRSDIYSLGATVYALLTGRPPFEGGSLPELVKTIRNEPPVKPKKYQLSIADMFQDAVLKMLEKRPEDRYPTPAALLKDLERIGRFQGIEV